MINKKINSIEFIRLLFAIIIIYYHILHSNIIDFINGNSNYINLRNMSNNASIIVECFFIISGYFLFITYKNKKNISILDFIIKKIVRLWPVLVVSIVISIVFFSQDTNSLFFNSLFLQCTGLSLDYKGINWYISCLFWVSIFYFSILKNFDNKKVNILIAIIVYFGYLINITYTQGSFGRETIYLVINLGMARALAGIGLGYLIGVLINNISSIQKTSLVLNRHFSKISFVILSITEVILFISLIKYFILGSSYNNDFIVVIWFSILFILLIYEKGILSKVLNKDVWAKFGRYAYSIYVMQQISFWILQKTIWKNLSFVNNTVICLIVSIACCIGVGILTYYTMELPAVRMWNKYLVNNRHRSNV